MASPSVSPDTKWRLHDLTLDLCLAEDAINIIEPSPVLMRPSAINMENHMAATHAQQHTTQNSVLHAGKRAGSICLLRPKQFLPNYPIETYRSQQKHTNYSDKQEVLISARNSDSSDAQHTQSIVNQALQEYTPNIG